MCECLTAEKIIDIPEFSTWTVAEGRWRCLESIIAVLRNSQLFNINYLPIAEEVSGLEKMAAMAVRYQLDIDAYNYKTSGGSDGSVVECNLNTDTYVLQPSEYQKQFVATPNLMYTSKIEYQKRFDQLPPKAIPNTLKIESANATKKPKVSDDFQLAGHVFRFPQLDSDTIVTNESLTNQNRSAVENETVTPDNKQKVETKAPVSWTLNFDESMKVDNTSFVKPLDQLKASEKVVRTGGVRIDDGFDAPAKLLPPSLRKRMEQNDGIQTSEKDEGLSPRPRSQSASKSRIRSGGGLESGSGSRPSSRLKTRPQSEQQDRRLRDEKESGNFGNAGNFVVGAEKFDAEAARRVNKQCSPQKKKFKNVDAVSSCKDLDEEIKAPPSSPTHRVSRAISTPRSKEKVESYPTSVLRNSMESQETTEYSVLSNNKLSSRKTVHIYPFQIYQAEFPLRCINALSTKQSEKVDTVDLAIGTNAKSVITTSLSRSALMKHCSTINNQLDMPSLQHPTQSYAMNIEKDLQSVHKGSVYAMDWHSGLKLCATGSNDKSVRIIRCGNESSL